MSVTIGGVTLKSLQAQPFGFEDTNTKGGLTARQWDIQGLVTGAEWAALLGVYDTWRNAKILEDPAEKTKVIGTTVAFSGSGYGGQTWSSIPCWFSKPPSGTQVASMVSMQCVLVDAEQAIQVIIKAEADDEVDDSSIDYGNLILGGVLIKLTEYPDIFPNNPTVDLTAGGKHYITGAPVVVYGKQVRGEIAGTDLTALRHWYTTTVQSPPVPGSYYPTSAPEFSGFQKLVAGAPVLYYNVSMTLVQIL